MHHLREESQFPTAIQHFHMQAPPASIVRYSGDLASWCSNPMLGSLIWVLDLLFLGEKFYNCFYPLIYGLPA